MDKGTFFMCTTFEEYDKECIAFYKISKIKKLNQNDRVFTFCLD
jgi:hypothetical protein